MHIDLLARRWGGPNGGPDGMAVAVAYLAWTLCELGHQVRAYAGHAGPAPWSHSRLEWRQRAPLEGPDDWSADLVITTISGSWRRTAEAAKRAGATGRLVYWHHHGGLPEALGCILAAPPAAMPSQGWARALVLPPSSWAAGVGGGMTGGEILVPGVGRAKGGPIALAVARACPDLRFYALPMRCGDADRAPWAALPNAELAAEQVPPDAFLGRARAVLSPTRAETYGLTIVEAAARGIPVVCSDLPATRSAAGDSAIYVPVLATPWQWVIALREALSRSLPRLQLPPYAQTVKHALDAMRGAA